MLQKGILYVSQEDAKCDKTCYKLYGGEATNCYKKKIQIVLSNKV